MSEDFSARYRLLKCVAVDEGVRTHNAQELASGRVVMVHIADAAGPDDVDRLRMQLSRLSGSDKNCVLETATLPSGFAIVTQFLMGMSSFAGWLAEHASAAPEPEAPTPSQSRVTEGVSRLEAGVEPRAELAAETETALEVDAEPTPAMATLVPATPVPATPVPAASVPAAPVPAPGVLTQMFGAPSAEARAAANSPAVTAPITEPIRRATAPLASAEAASLPVPAAFASEPTPPTAPTAPTAAPPGTFTQMFGAATLPEPSRPSAPISASPAERRPAAPAAPAAPHISEPGEFTRLFSAAASSDRGPATAFPAATGSAAPNLRSTPPVFSPSSDAASAFDGRSADSPVTSPLFGGGTANAGLHRGPPPQPMARSGSPPAPFTPQPFAAPLAAPPFAAGASAAPPIATSSVLSDRSPARAPSAVPLVMPPPTFQGVEATPLTPQSGAAPAGSAAGPSDFTRFISQAPAAAVPAVAPAAPAAAKESSSTRRVPQGLIIVINVVVLIAIVLVAVVLRRPRLQVPARPAIPTAPAIPKAPALPPPPATTPPAGEAVTR